MYGGLGGANRFFLGFTGFIGWRARAVYRVSCQGRLEGYRDKVERRVQKNSKARTPFSQSRRRPIPKTRPGHPKPWTPSLFSLLKRSPDRLWQHTVFEVEPAEQVPVEV